MTVDSPLKHKAEDEAQAVARVPSIRPELAIMGTRVSPKSAQRTRADRLNSVEYLERSR